MLSQGEHTSGSGSPQSIDWVFVRKIAGTPTTSEPSVGSFGTAEIGEAPVAFWKFDEGQGNYAYDASGNGNHGYVIIGTGGTQSTTSSAWTAGSSGKFNSSMSFDGTDDYVDVGTGLDQNGTLTLTAWIKASSISGLKAIIGNSNAAGNAIDYLMEIGRTTCKITGLRSAAAVSVTGKTCLTAGTWYHVAYVISGATGNWTNTLYLNGVQDGSAVDVNNPSGVNQITRIGHALGNGAAGFFSGQIDDARVYNYALSASQIKEVFNNGKAVYFK